MASLAGVYGLSGLLVLVGRRRAPGHRPWPLRWVTAAATALLIAAGTWWGAARVSASRLTSEGTPVRVGVLQGNIEQEQKWDPRLVESPRATWR